MSKDETYETLLAKRIVILERMEKLLEKQLRFMETSAADIDDFIAKTGEQQKVIAK